MDARAIRQAERVGLRPVSQEESRTPHAQPYTRL